MVGGAEKHHSGEGWTASDYDTCMYYRATGGGELNILMTYVDILLTGNNHDEITRIKRQLLLKYEGRDLGTPKRILEVNISITERGISLNQQLYAEIIVSEGMESVQVRGESTPLDPGMDMTARREYEGILDGNIYSYPTLVGKLMFLAGMTRPDLSNSVRKLGRRTNAPCLRHWRGLQHVLRYITTHPYIGVSYDRQNEEAMNNILTGYSDSDWGGDTENRRSVTGYIILINGSPVAWKSKQGTVTLSSSEAEWTAMVHGMRHCLHIKGIIQALLMSQDTTQWYCDNREAIIKASTPDLNGRTKHTDIKLKC
ncbi:unnamed protein product [Discosporangium mesarthrocarpum]